jgi:hypothetical protein
VEPPLLFRGRKFHVRVNALLVGRLAAFVHEAVVLHVACAQYRAADWHDRFVHVTNHVQQSLHPGYCPAECQRSLGDLEAALCEERGAAAGAGAAQRVLSGLEAAVGAVARAMQRCARAYEFLATPDSFELLGLDFIVRDDAGFSVALLEINSGPALEGHASMRARGLCGRIVGDALDVVLGGWLDAAAGAPRAERLAAPEGPRPEPRGGFRLVYRDETVPPHQRFLSPAFREHVRRYCVCT